MKKFDAEGRLTVSVAVESFFGSFESAGYRSSDDDGLGGRLRNALDNTKLVPLIVGPP